MGIGIRVIVHKPEGFKLGNLFGEIINQRGNALKVKLSQTLQGSNFKSNVIIFHPEEGKSFKPLSQFYAVFVSGYLYNEISEASEYILYGTISYD